MSISREALIDALAEECGYDCGILQSCGYLSRDGDFWPVEFAGHGAFASALFGVLDNDFGYVDGWLVITAYKNDWQIVPEGPMDVPLTVAQWTTLGAIVSRCPTSLLSRRILEYLHFDEDEYYG